jgi:hypothetical protein
LLKCPDCGAEIPDVSRFCLSCGKSIPAPKEVPAQQNEDPDPNGFSMILVALSFMLFFFAIVPVIFRLWIGAGLMIGAGIVMVVVAVMMIRSNKKEIEKEHEEASIRVKCQYCGTLNTQTAERCDSCGATL